MPARRAPLFLARRSYRRRRMMDAARLLPLLGAFLFGLPILWSPGIAAPRETARGLVYVFAVWAGLILLAALLARRLAPALDEEGEAEAGSDRPEQGGPERGGPEKGGAERVEMAPGGGVLPEGPGPTQPQGGMEARGRAAAHRTAADEGRARGLPVARGAEVGISDTGAVAAGPAEMGPAEAGPVETGRLETGPVESGPAERRAAKGGPGQAGTAEPGDPTGDRAGGAG